MFFKQSVSKNIAVFRYEPSDNNLLEKKGELFCFVNVSAGNSQQDLGRILKFIWDGIVDEYSYSKSSPLESLKSALREGEVKLRAFIRTDPVLVKIPIELNISLLVIKDGNIYLAKRGKHFIAISRDEKIIDLSEILSTHNVIAGSSQLNDKDILLVSTMELKDRIIDNNNLLENALKISSNLPSMQGILLLSEKDIFKSKDDFLNRKLENETERPLLISESVDFIEEEPNENITETVDIKQKDSSELEENVEVESSNSQIDIKEDSTLSTGEESLPQVKFEENLENPEENQEDSFDQIVYGPVSFNKKSKLNKVGLKEISLSIKEFILNIPEKLKKINIKKIGKIRNNDGVSDVRNIKLNSTLSKIIGFITKGFTVIVGIISKIADIVGNIVIKAFSFVGTAIKNLLDKQFGHKPWYKKFMARITQSRVGNVKSSVTGNRVDNYKTVDMRKKRLGIFFVLIIILFIGYIGYKETQKIKDDSEIHDRVVYLVKEAETFISLAEANKSDLNVATTHLNNATTKLNEAQSLAKREADINLISQSKEKIQGIDDSMNRKVGVSEEKGNIELYIDGKISLNEKSLPTDINIFKYNTGVEQLFIADQGAKAVYKVDLSDKKITKIPDSQGVLSSPTYLSPGVIYDGELYVLAVYDKNSGVAVSFANNGELTDFKKVAGLGAETLNQKNISDISVLTNNANIFLLSKTDTAIWRSSRDDYDNYSLLERYYQSNALSQGNTIMADISSVYAVFSGGDAVNRIRGGQAISMQITGVNPAIQSVQTGYTGELPEQKMYLFDSKDKRIIVLEKPNDETGLHPDQFVMVKQIVYRGERTDVFNNVKSIVVDWNEDYLYVLDGVRIWKINLRSV